MKRQIENCKDWQTRVMFIEILHAELMIIRKKWSVRKTAALIDFCASTVCEDLQLAKALSYKPSIGNIRTRKEALREIKND